jgi:hypothetical protein
MGQFSLFLYDLTWNRQLMVTVLLYELVTLIWPVVAYFLSAVFHTVVEI